MNNYANASMHSEAVIHGMIIMGPGGVFDVQSAWHKNRVTVGTAAAEAEQHDDHVSSVHHNALRQILHTT